jgi:hypothetical protein
MYHCVGIQAGMSTSRTFAEDIGVAELLARLSHQAAVYTVGGNVMIQTQNSKILFCLFTAKTHGKTYRYKSFPPFPDFLH